MKNKMNHLLFLLILAACVPPVHQKPPDWALGAPIQKPGEVSVVGIDENGRLESLANALYAFSEMAEMKIQVMIDHSEFASSMTIGNIEISGMLTDMVGANKSFTSHSNQILYNKENSSMLIRNYMEETAIGENSQTMGNVTITYENANYSDLLKELENFGIVVKTAYDGKMHYTLLEAPLSIFSK